MKKRILSLLLVAAMAVGMMVGCGKKEEPAPTPSTQQQEQEKTDAADASSVVEPEVDYDSLPTINVLFVHAYGMESDENVIWREVAKKVGAKIHFITADTDKRNTMIASGEGYDILMSTGGDMKTQAEGGSLVALDDLISDEVKELLPQYIATSKERYSHDGKLYWLPYGATFTDAYAGDKAPGRSQIRWDLYREMGAPEIKTFMDIPEVLADMVEKYPTSAAGDTAYAAALPSESGVMMNMLITLAANSMNRVGNNAGVLDYSYTDMSFVSTFDDEEGAFWLGIDFWNKMWNLGIMDPDSFAMAEADMKAKVSAGQLYYTAFSWQYDAGTPMMTVPYTQATTNGKLTNKKTNGLENFSWGHAINKKTELLDECVAYLNLIHTVEGCNLILNGIEGVHWEYVDGKRTYTDYAWSLYNTEAHEAWEKEGLWTAESHNMLGLNQSVIIDDGQTLLLHKDPSFFETGLTDTEKDFCEFYGVDYPMQAYFNLMKKNNVPTNESHDPYVAAFLPSSATAPDDIKQKEGNVMLEAEQWVAKMIKAKPAELEQLKADCMAALEKAGLSDVEKYYQDNWQAGIDKAAQYK